jgi:hypothetical protein
MIDGVAAKVRRPRPKLSGRFSMFRAIKTLFYGSMCVALVGFLGWANATGYVMFGQATKYTPTHSSSLYHK